MGWEENLKFWLTSSDVDEDTKQLIRQVVDRKQLEDMFCSELFFGTGGMRGIMGPGNNRINRYTIARASFGVAQWLKQQVVSVPSVVIAYDTRNQSRELSLHCALVLAEQGVTVWLFDQPTPTPVLSFAIRELQCTGGIVITASHNPPAYNGFKVYGADGCQLLPGGTKAIMKLISSVDMFRIPLTKSEMQLRSIHRLKSVPEELNLKFLAAAKELSLLTADDSKAALKIVFSPLHGTGHYFIPAILRADHFTSVRTVKEQEEPDGNFHTVDTPNPEDPKSLEYAIELAQQEQADIVIASDPDCDRIGAAVRTENKYIPLSGNQIGVVLLDFILSQRKMLGKLPHNGLVVKTIVTSELGASIANKYDMRIENTLTGFKYIGDAVTRYERNKEHSFVFGYEESCGYLAGNHVRDKDAVSSAMLFCEAAAHCKDRGMTLWDYLQQLYEEHGFYLDILDSYTLRGPEGTGHIQSVMKKLRSSAVLSESFELLDYKLGTTALPPEDVLKFLLVDGSWIAVRPSGTEPKLKIYYSLRGADKKSAQARLALHQKYFLEVLDL